MTADVFRKKVSNFYFFTAIKPCKLQLPTYKFNILISSLYNNIM